MKKVFLKDIAQNLGVSKTTVSFVLNGKGDQNKISIHTQNKILDYAKANNYMPNQLARGLSLGKTETIGLIIPNISDAFYAMIAGHIEKKAKASGYTVVFSSSNESAVDEAKLIQGMLNRQVDGLIIASTQQNQKEVESLKKMNFPFVLIDRHYPNISTNHVIVDNYGGVKSAAKHLIGLGRRHLGFITLESSLEAMLQRLKGYEDALFENGLEPAFLKKLDSNHVKQAMKQAVNQLLQAPKKPDAIIFSTHYLTSIGLRELKEKNINIPSDIAIVSFDEMSAFDLVEPPITSIIQPVDGIGDAAVKMLLDAMDDKNETIKNKVVLNTKLKIRKSCGFTKSLWTGSP